MEWIDVNDRLPDEPNKCYLCWDNGIEVYEWTGTKWIEPYFGKTVAPTQWIIPHNPLKQLNKNKMTRKEFAEMLNGRQYRNEMSPTERKTLKDLGFVAVFGGSDDLMEFEGAIYDEVGCYDGGIAKFTKDGKFTNSAPNKIKAVWCPSQVEGSPSWIYETSIPHDTFKIYEDGELYCIGIVFNISDLS